MSPVTKDPALQSPHWRAFSVYVCRLLHCIFMQTDDFTGDKKVGKSALEKTETKLKKFLVPFVPRWLETYHLTLLTIAWSVLIIGCGYVAQTSLHWFWAASLLIVCQYLTDLLDGEIGRERNTGLLRWGYYMDHFLDYIFLCAMLISYVFILPTELIYTLFFLLVMAGSFMVNSFLGFAVTNEFRVSYLGVGPTEVRIGFIIANALLSVFGKTYLANTIPFLLAFAFFGLLVTVYRTQKQIWENDMKNKNTQK